MKTLEFTHTVTKDREGTYYTIPFPVPENVVKMTVSYSYDHASKGLARALNPKNIVDFGLLDGDRRFLGWSGSAHSSVTVGEYGSSAGYLATPVKAGEWHIIIGAYHIMESGADVRYTVEFKEKGEELLFGDLHIHSNASDGRFDTFTLAKMAKDKGLDFIAIANHNNYSENFNLPRVNGLTLIPAVEWTHYKGHLNFFGVKAPFENLFVANDGEEMKKLISAARDMGAVISVNHPKCPFCPYLWGDNDAFDMIEVWNGPMRKTNLRGIAFWTQLLGEGRKIPILGGSDYHKPRSFMHLGIPATAVYSKSRNADDILKAIRNGHSFVTRNIRGPRLDMRCGEARLGDTVKADLAVRLIITAENLRGARLILVTQNGEITLGRGWKKPFSADKTVSGTGFAYLKAVQGRAVRAISNPIYFDK